MKKDKIIFLDIDGVLNSEKSMSKIGKEYFEDIPHKMHIKHLYKIIKATGAIVVISSTWRLGCSNYFMFGYLFYALGFKIEVIGITPRIPGEQRGQEIQKWIKQRNIEANRNNSFSDYINEVGNFIILDDDSDMKGIMDHLILTDGRYGLQKKHIKQAIKMLNQK